MKNIFTLLFIAAGLTAISQPVVEATYLPVHNTIIKQVYDTVAADLIVPTRGPNQVWDYSLRFTNILDTFDLQTYDAATTPYISVFPDATHASFLRAPFNLADSIYSYFVVDTNGIQNLGFYSTKTQFDTSFISNPTEWVTNATIHYGDQVYDTSRTEGILKDYYQFGPTLYDVKYVSYRYKDMLVDGHGTLSTPLGTFSDVLLGTEKQHTVDSLFYNLGAGWVFLRVDEDYFHRFHFLRNNTFATTHLMELNSDTLETAVSYGWFTLPADIGSISGTVYDTSGLGITNGEMILYREHSNFTRNDILARTQVNASGNYQFDSIPYGEYRVACRPDLNTYVDAMTTYVGDTTDWINCQTIITTANSTGNDITLVYHEAQVGSGSISGSLQQNYAYSKGNGDPIPGIDIIIEKTPSGTVKSSSSSNSGGGFSFSNLNDGDYTIFVDIPGLNMTGSYNFTISGGTSASGFDFKVGFDSIHPTGSITSIQPIIINKGFVSAYPNPFSTNTTIEVEMIENNNVEINVFNILGERIVELVNEKLNTGTHTFNFSAESYAKGIYFAKIKIDNEEQVIKLIQK
jgi:hypothetical protein